MANPFPCYQPIDIKAPSLLAATIAADGVTITADFDENIVINDPGGFSITPSDGAATLTLASVSGTHATFTASREIYNYETGVFSYASTPGDVTDLSRNTLPNSGVAFVNNSTQEPPEPDVTAPEHVSTTIGSSGTIVSILFNEPVNISSAAGLTLTPSGGAATLTYLSGSGNALINFTTSRPVVFDETGTIVFDDALGNIEDIAGNPLASFAATAFVNDSTYDPSDPFLPIPPETFNTDYDLPVGGTLYQPMTGAAFQIALDDCELGDVIELAAGVTYTGNFVLPIKSTGTGWIYIISSELDQLPEGVRVGPSDAAHMPTLTHANYQGPVVMTQYGAHHYRMAGIQITTTGVDKLELIRLGYGREPGATFYEISNANTAEELPSHLTFDRMLMRSLDDSKKLRHGFIFSGYYLAVVDSYIDNVKDGADAQCVFIWNGGSHYKIVNNFLEATGENIIVGGTDPQIPNAVPSDLEIRGNHMFKRLGWKTSPPNWSIKNTFELKNARRVWVSGNVLENNWTDSQTGVMVLFTVRNQSGTAPWSIITDVNFENNILLNSSRFFNVTASDDLQTSQQTQRIRIHNNVGTEASYDHGSQPGFMQFSGLAGIPILYVTVTHNTFLSPTDENSGPYTHTAFPNPTGVDHLIYQNNIIAHGYYGHDWTKTTNSTHSHNVLAMNPLSARYAFNKGIFAATYPGDFMADPGQAAIGFVDLNGGNLRLDASSTFKGDGVGGVDPGCDIDELEAATAGAITGIW